MTNFGWPSGSWRGIAVLALWGACAPAHGMRHQQCAIDLAALTGASHVPTTLRVHQTKSAVSLHQLADVVDSVKRHAPHGNLVPAPDASYVEVVQLAELPDTYVAVFSHSRFMNLALDRASQFVEQNKMATHEGLIYSHRKAAGHDLKGADLMRFWTEFQRVKGSFRKPLNDWELLEIENDFWLSVIIPRLARNPNLVLLAVAADGNVETVLGHELLHAQYFKDARYQQIVQDFWRQSVSEADKDGVKSLLTDHYDVTNDALVVNEFQAYLLQADPKSRTSGRLAPYVDRYREPLLARLREAGVDPIQFRFHHEPALGGMPFDADSPAWLRSRGLLTGDEGAIVALAGPYPEGTQLGGMVRTDAFQVISRVHVGDSAALQQLARHPGIFDADAVNRMQAGRTYGIDALLAPRMAELVNRFEGRSGGANNFGAVLYALGFEAEPKVVSTDAMRFTLMRSFREFDPTQHALEPGDVLIFEERRSGEWFHAGVYLWDDMAFSKVNPMPTAPYAVETLGQTIRRLHGGSAGSNDEFLLRAFRVKR